MVFYLSFLSIPCTIFNYRCYWKTWVYPFKPF